MEMTIIFKDESKHFIQVCISSYEFIANKFLKVTSHCGDTIYTEFYDIDDISKISIEEDAREFERRNKVEN